MKEPACSFSILYCSPEGQINEFAFWFFILSFSLHVWWFVLIPYQGHTFCVVILLKAPIQALQPPFLQFFSFWHLFVFHYWHESIKVVKFYQKFHPFGPLEDKTYQLFYSLQMNWGYHLFLPIYCLQLDQQWWGPIHCDWLWQYDPICGHKYHHLMERRIEQHLSLKNPILLQQHLLISKC